MTGAEDITWSRVMMKRDCERLIAGLEPARLNVLEISGDRWARQRFAKYKSVHYPAYDVCAEALPECFDLVIAEQVFEHLLWHGRAGKNVHQMLVPGGHFLISTPFLYRIHRQPEDCTRWTETGLKYFLAECGFELDQVQTNSWGNRGCVKANLGGYVQYRRRLHSLRNEPDLPIHVWALARK